MLHTMDCMVHGVRPLSGCFTLWKYGATMHALLVLVNDTLYVRCMVIFSRDVVQDATHGAVQSTVHVMLAILHC
jgi:hypothetical protein